MLPGFRFLFAAIVLSMSIMVFGLGAAALLRAAHETFASTPSWHASPETNFAQQSEASRPVLSMLRVDPPIAEVALDNAPAVTAPPVATAPTEPVAIAPTPPEQVTTTPAPSEPEQVAALQPADSPTPADARPDVPVADNPPQDQAAPAQDEPAAPQATAPVAAADETKVAATTAATEQTASPAASEPAPAAETAPATPEPVGPPSAANAETFSTTIATLGGPPVNIAPVAKAAGPKPGKSATKKHEEAKRTHRRRRVVLRAQLAQTQQPVDPFAQPSIVAPRVRKPR